MVSTKMKIVKKEQRSEALVQQQMMEERHPGSL